jgi:HPt (histidine-containing phosphotransfer) domain-containing protein
MNDDLQQQLIQDLLIESFEGLENFDQLMLDLENGTDDPDTMNQVFRVIHTIKGTSGCIGLSKIESVAHVGESLLSLVRDRKLKITSEMITTLLALSDALREMLTSLEQTGKEGETDYTALKEKLQALQNPGAVTTENAATPPAESAPVEPPPAAPEEPATFGLFSDEDEPVIEPALEPAAPPPPVETVPQAAEPERTARSPVSESVVRVGVGVDQLDKLMNLVGDLRRGFDLNAYRHEIGAMLRTELDFHHEAAATTEFRHHIGADPDLADHVETPVVIPELSNDRLLVTTWLKGGHFSEVGNWSVPFRHHLATTLLRLFLRSCFEWGQIHADPHPGNYRFRLRDHRPVIGLLDFGCVKRIPDALAAGFHQLITEGAAQTIDEQRAREIHLAMGFNAELLQPLDGRLAELSRLLFVPFTKDEPFDISRWQVRDSIAELLGEHRMNYRLAGPPEMIYLLRSFQGLLHYLKALNTPVNWYRLFRETRMNELAGSPPVAPIVSAPTADNKGGMLSETLHISVTENGSQKVALCFGAGAAANLADLVPGDLRPKLEQRGIRLADIAINARQNQFAPGELFLLTDGPKSVRVWLD